MIKEKEFIDIPNAIQKFKKDTRLLFLLKKDEINFLKSQLNDNFNNINSLKPIIELKDETYELEIKSTYIKYKYINKNKTEEREEIIINVTIIPCQHNPLKFRSFPCSEFLSIHILFYCNFTQKFDTKSTLLQNMA